MKKILYILLTASLLTLTSCFRDEIPGGGGKTEGEKQFTFALNIPGAGYITRSMEAYPDSGNLLIGNLWVMVFDGNGYISRHQAVQGSGNAQFTVDLPMSGKARILHFVANYDWTGFDDEAMSMMNEATVMTAMSRRWNYDSDPVPAIPILYWTRLEFPSGITSTTSLGAQVTLTRNVAQISVVDNSAAAAPGDDDSYLTDVQFAIGNYLDRGTVTNFNKITGSFDGDGILEATGAVPVGLTNADEDKFVDAYTGSVAAADGVSLFTYERRNSNPNDEDHIYIIVRGIYHESTFDVTGNERYYKIDIVREGDTELMDVLRNRHYVMTINQVLNEGYDTIEEAVASLALNNIATSVMQSYNSISDGTSILNIEYVNRTFVAPSFPFSLADFAIRYSYIPDATTGATDNANVLMDWGPKPADSDYATAAVASLNPLPNDKYVTNGDYTNPIYPPGFDGEYVDRVSGKLAASLPSAGVYSSWIRIYKGSLSRTINLRLRNPYEFTNMAISPSVVPSTVGAEVAISFNVPATVEDQLPFVVYIYADMLAPDPTKSNVFHDDSEGVYRHRYTVTATGAQTIYFRTGSTIGEGEITLRSDLFNDANGYLYRDRRPKLDIVNVTPNGAALPPELGQEITLTLATPGEYIQGQKLYVLSTALEIDTNRPPSDGGNLYKANVDDNFYTYIPAAGGAQTLNLYFKTARELSDEQLILRGESLEEDLFERTSYRYDLNASFTTLPNNKVRLDFTIYNRSGGGPTSLEMYIQSNNLAVDPSVSQPDLVAGSLGENINGFTYTTTVTANQESRSLYFEIVNTDPETVTIFSDKYNTATLNLN